MIPEEKLPTIDIKGKDYVQAKDRVLELHKQNDKFSLTTLILSDDDKRVTMQTTLEIDGRVFTGIASELKNQEKPYENCETSSVSRCLGFYGIGIIESIASADCMVSYENTKGGNKSYGSDSNDFATPNQIKYIKSLCVERGIPEDKYPLEEMTKQEASDIIKIVMDIDVNRKHKIEGEYSQTHTAHRDDKEVADESKNSNSNS